VGASQNAFAIESFVDELARAAGRDPCAYRLDLLAGRPRERAVLEAAARAAGWDRAPPAGLHRGLALYHCFHSTVAQVVEISLEGGGVPRVHRVVCAVDCGRVVSPDGVVAQVEGAVVFGLSAALHGEITLAEGLVQQSSFADYRILTLPETPAIEVHILPGTAPPTGVGEPPVPPVAPALANALFAASGQRLRRLPLRLADGADPG
jgi:isoquinoline 1-oxidoreductase beta subunit